MKIGVSYFGNRILKHVKEDLQNIVEHSCNYVVHTFSENDLKYYKETMQDIIKVSHNLGLEVYIDPWGVGGVFGGEAFSNFLLENPDVWQVTSNGTAVPIACLNNEKFKEFLKGWISVAVDLGSDVIFWDEPHLYINKLMEDKLNQWACLCEICKQKFKQKFNYEMPTEFSQDIVKFREESIVNFLTEMSAFAHQKGIKNAVCLLPIENPIFGVKNWDKVCGIETIDIFGTDPYWISFEQKAALMGFGGKVLKSLEVGKFVGYFSQKTQDLCKKYGKEGQIWIQSFKIPEGREQELTIAIDTAYNVGIRNIAAWGYDGCKSMSSIRSDRPDIVWEILGKAFRKILRECF
ncbi:hypothetical protein J7M02_01270 [Candidatus Aerophobetes bacterium]|nr:hypothetical protein [Candidatus Aerophobetes bacterium]